MSNPINKPAKTSRRSGTEDTTGDIARIFKPVEHAILSKFLRLSNLLPEWAKEIDLAEFPAKGWDEAVQGIAPLGAIEDHNVLENAVARIALAPIQDRLPQWAAYNLNYKPVFGRTLRPFPVRKATSRPLLLFAINWATSGPGFDWPEHYHVTWIPYYNEYLVTASSDSKVVHGFEDIALGSFTPSSKRGADKESIAGIISWYWGDLYSNGQETPWESLWRGGAIGHDFAEKWRDGVWSPEVVEAPEEEVDEDEDPEPLESEDEENV